MTGVGTMVDRVVTRVPIEDMANGRGKVRSTARTSVAGLGDVMTRRLNEEFAVAQRGPLPRLCVYPILCEVIITSRDANYDRKNFYKMGPVLSAPSAGMGVANSYPIGGSELAPFNPHVRTFTDQLLNPRTRISAGS